VTVEAPAAVSLAEAICARQRRSVEMRVDAVKMVAQWRRWRLPVTGCAPFGSETGNIGGEWRLRVNLVPRAGRPPPLYIAQCDGGPPTM
jgi:hypothetical protein